MIGVTADLVGTGEAEPAVVGGVLDALGHDRAAGLLEAHPEVVGERAGVERGVAQVAVEHEVDDHAERGLVGRSQVGACATSRSLDDRRLLGVGRTPGHDVGAVAVHRDEQGLERAPGRRLVQVGQDAPHQPHEPVDLGGLHVVDDQALGLGDHVVQRPALGRGLRPQPVEHRSPRRRGEHLLHPQQRVVARRAGAPPRVGQLLVALEDLLDDDPGVPRGAVRGSRRGRRGRRGGRCGSRRPRRARAGRAAGRGWP